MPATARQREQIERIFQGFNQPIGPGSRRARWDRSDRAWYRDDLIEPDPEWQSLVEQLEARSEVFGEDHVYNTLPDHIYQIATANTRGDGDPLGPQTFRDHWPGEDNPELVARELAGLEPLSEKDLRMPEDCPGSNQPAVLNLPGQTDRMAQGLGGCVECGRLFSVTAEGLLYPHYERIEDALRRRKRKPKAPMALAERNHTNGTIAPGEIWESTSAPHRGLRVQVEPYSNPEKVKVRTIKGGNSQNNRRVRHRQWHIPLNVLLTHYQRVTEAEASPKPDRTQSMVDEPSPDRNGQVTDESTSPLREAALSLGLRVMTPKEALAEIKSAEPPEPTAADQPPLPEPAHPRFEEWAHIIVSLLERWGGQPVKTYVISQYGPKAMRSQFNEVVDYGVERGLLDTWYVQPRADRPNVKSQMVGLAGGSREPKYPDGRYPGSPRRGLLDVWQPAPTPTPKTPIPTPLPNAPRFPIDTDANVAHQRALDQIEEQYQRLSEQDRADIVNLARSDVPTLEIQRAYGVFSAVVARVKREAGLPMVRPHRKRTKQVPAPTTSEESEEPTSTSDSDTVSGRRPDESLQDWALRRIKEAPPSTLAFRSAPAAAPAAAPPTERTESTGDWARYSEPEQRWLPVPESSPSSQTSEPAFNVTVVVMRPSEMTLTITAPTMEAALHQARKQEHVVDVLSVSRAP